MEMKKLIVIDLDGTLLIEGKDIVSKENIKILKQIYGLGHHLAISTGRCWLNTKEIYNQIGCINLVGNYNGSLIHQPKTKTSFYQNKLEDKIVREIVESKIFKENCSNFLAEDPYHPILLKEDNALLKQRQINITPSYYHDVSDVSTYSLQIQIDISKHSSEQVYEWFKKKFPHVDIYLWPEKDYHDFIQITPLNSNKGTGLKVMAKTLKIDLKNTIAIGDSNNDLEMIKQANVGVCMKNGNETIKQVANIVTKHTQNESGVGKFLKEYFQLK